jgi:hypothetical protein
MIKAIRKQLKAQDALWAFMRKYVPRLLVECVRAVAWRVSRPDRPWWG